MQAVVGDCKGFKRLVPAGAYERLLFNGAMGVQKPGHMGVRPLALRSFRLPPPPPASSLV